MCKLTDWCVFLMLGICGYRDWKKREIPILWLVIMSVIIVVFAVLCDCVGMRLRVAGILLGVVFLLISKCTKEAIGYGDSWLILLLGIHLGSLRTISVLFGASILAGISSLFFLWKHHWKRNATLPFVPFLTISYLGGMFL